MKKIFFLLLLIAATFCSYGQKDTLASTKSPVFKNFSELRAAPANQLDTGTIYFRNTARVFVPYKWNPASTAKDDSVSVIQRNGRSVGRFELYFEDYIMVDWFGAVPDDGNDDSYYVQKAVNFALNSSKSPQVRFSGGVYHVSNVKLAKKVDKEYAFSTVEIRGSGFVSGTHIIVKGNGVGFFVQNGRQTVIDNISFQGEMAIPKSAKAMYSQSDAEWVVGVRNNSYSPHAAIADGAFASTVKPQDQYPGESAWYTNSNNSGTSGLQITNCAFYRFNVAIVQGCNGRNANGDNVSIEDCTFLYNRIVYAPSQTQSRANSIVNCYMMYQQFVVRGDEFGNGLGTPPNLVQCNIAGATKYLYCLNTMFGGMTIDRCRMESIFSLGRSEGIAINFINCEITPAIPGEESPYGATKFAEGGHVSFKGGELKWFDNFYVGGFVFDVENLSFDGVTLGGLPVNFWSGPVFNFFLNRTVYNNCKFFSSTTKGEVWQANVWEGLEITNFAERAIVMPGSRYVETNVYDHLMFNSYESLSPKIELIHIEDKTVRLDSIRGKAYFISSHPGSYKMYDLLSAAQARTMPGSIYRPGPSVLGWVSEVSRDTVKLTYVPYGLNERTTYGIQITRIPHFAPKLIGDISTGSNQISNAKYIGQRYPAGIMIKAPGLPKGTRVVSVQGNTITLSNKATANATGIEFYDARIYCSAVGNPANATSTFGYYKGDIMRNTDPGSNKISHWVCTRGGWILANSPQTPVWEPVSLGSNGSSNVSDGSYTATVTNGANVNSSNFRSAQYQRVGNTVTLSAVLDINATAAGAFTVDISLPVASNFTSAYDAAGTASNGTNTGSIYANAADDRLKLSGVAPRAGTTQWTVQVTYRVVGK